MKKVYFLGIIIVLLYKCDFSDNAKILGVFPSPGYSQYILVEPLLVLLAQRGHNVTVISGFETKNVKNLHNIVVDLVGGEDISTDLLFQLQELSIFVNIGILNQLCLSWVEKLLSNKNVQALIHSEEDFDIVIIETFLSEALQAFAKHFNAHQVLFSSIAVSEWNTHLVGIPHIPSYMPITFSGYTTNMNFYERFRNTLALFYDRYYKYFYSFPAHQELVLKYFPNNYVLNDFIYNSSLMLTCSHVSTSQSLPLANSVVEVIGLHIKNKKLPEDIQQILDSAKDGAIFFSMGSNINSADMSKEKLDAIMDVIKSLKQKVLWKFEKEDLANKPKNIFISKWFPQSDILAHPNTVAFISHCGMGSTTEAVYHGVPVIGIPVYGDQFMNVRKLVEHGMAIELVFKDMTIETFNNSIQEILHLTRYRENAKKRSKIMQDRPIKPLDEAVYWIEYILRHGGAHHLKSSVYNLWWYQLYLVDIFVVLSVCLILLMSMIKLFFRWICRSVGSKTKND